MSPAPTSPTDTTTATTSFALQPPEVITPVPAERSREAVPLDAKVQHAVDEQVLRFIDALASEDVHSDAFKTRLDSAFALGKEEVSNAASLMQGGFMQRNFVGIEDSPAYQAIADIRAQLDELNPRRDGDLMQPRKLLGLIPFGNKLEAYFRKYQGAAEQLKTSMGQLYAARDDMQRSIHAWPRRCSSFNPPMRSAPRRSNRRCCSTRARTCRTFRLSRRCASTATWRSMF
jgi:hypothetical protein